MAPARLGIGLTVEVSLAVPSGSITYWQQRLSRSNVQQGEVESRFGENTLPFTDPHGLQLALVETDDERTFVPWLDSPVPAEFQVRGMHLVRLWERDLAPTEALLTQQMGFISLGTEDGWHRYGVEGGGSGKLLEIKESPGERRGQWGIGGVHHVAWRTSDPAEEMALRAEVARTGLHPTDLIDRFWFQSVYFKEPGGVLFELATDGPGFSVDEDAAHLGEQLVLPPWLESSRSQIELMVPPLRLPGAETGTA
jgi:glyoxalase family protein